MTVIATITPALRPTEQKPCGGPFPEFLAEQVGDQGGVHRRPGLTELTGVDFRSKSPAAVKPRARSCPEGSGRVNRLPAFLECLAGLNHIEGGEAGEAGFGRVVAE